MFAYNPSSYDRRYSHVNTEYTQDISSYSGQPWYPNISPHQATPVAPAYELRERQTPVQSSATHITAPWPRRSATNYSAVQQDQEISHVEHSPPGSVGVRNLNTGYNPLFTRKWILWCFSFLWFLIIASLQVLYSVSEAQKGLATTDTSLRYLWTYGPTAFLVVVTVVWRQVDYAGEYPSNVSCALPESELANFKTCSEICSALGRLSQRPSSSKSDSAPRLHYLFSSGCVLACDSLETCDRRINHSNICIHQTVDSHLNRSSESRNRPF